MREDDTAAFTALMRAYADMLANVAYTIVRRDGVPQEIVQEVFFRVWDTRRELHIRGSLAAYLVRVTRNLAIDTIRHERSQARLAEAIRDVDCLKGKYATNAGEGAVIEEELDVAVAAALETLPPRMREIFLLRVDQGLRAPEIAQIFGVTSATVHNELYRATKILAARLNHWL